MALNANEMSVTTKKPAVCYVVNHYTTSSHTAHLPRFFRELSQYAEVHVVLWSHSGAPRFAGVTSVTLLATTASNRFFRMVMMLLVAWRLRRRGCRVFFVRIQDTVAIVLSVLRKVMGIEVFLWRSGLHEFTRPVGGSGPMRVARQLWWRVRWKVVFPLAGRMVTRFVTGPASMGDYYQANYGIPASKTLLFDNDVDVAQLSTMSGGATTRKKLGVEADAEVLTYVGRVAPLNLGDGEAIIRTADAILSRRPQAHLALVGAVAFPGFQERLEQFEWAERVHLTGLLPFEEVVGHYLATDVCIFPVIAAGFPRVLLEAMALGVPFVSTDVGGVRDLLAPQQEAFVVPWGDHAGFTQRVETLLDDASLRQEMRKVGRQRVKAFSTEVVARAFFDKIVRPYYGDSKR